MTSEPLRQEPAAFRSIEAAAIAGFAFALLYSAALVLLSLKPSLTAPAAELADWYREAGNRQVVVVAFNLAVFSSIAFLWFIAVIRRRIGDREDRFFATVFLGSGILFAALMIVGLALQGSVAVAIDLTEFEPGRESLSLTLGMSDLVMRLAVPRVQAVFIITTSALGRQAKVLPQWLVAVGYLIALGLIVVPIFTDVARVGFAIWVALVSATLLVRSHEADPD